MTDSQGRGLELWRFDADAYSRLYRVTFHKIILLLKPKIYQNSQQHGVLLDERNNPTISQRSTRGNLGVSMAGIGFWSPGLVFMGISSCVLSNPHIFLIFRVGHST